MTGYRATIGARGEAVAAAFLQARGYELVDRNYRCRYGEVDLILKHGQTIVFCEVKLRRSGQFGTPEEAITKRKLARVALTAQTYLVDHDCVDVDWRIDVVAIELDDGGRLMRAGLYESVGDM